MDDKKLLEKCQKFNEFVEVIRKLRSKTGCPWDRKQTHNSLKPYLIEETYELLDIIDEKDFTKMRDELGDILLQVFLHSQIASEEKKFDIYDVLDGISAKMVRRHPHVFANKKVKDIKEVWQNWEKIKEKEVKKTKKGETSILDSVPKTLPALHQADKVQKKAARVGFDWDTIAGAWTKVYEEISEVHQIFGHREMKKSGGKRGRQIKKSEISDEKLEEEIGDLLFSVVNVARKMDLSAEEALRKATKKFKKRFKELERYSKAKGKDLVKMPLKEMDEVWGEIKKNRH